MLRDAVTYATVAAKDARFLKKRWTTDLIVARFADRRAVRVLLCAEW